MSIDFGIKNKMKGIAPLEIMIRDRNSTLFQGSADSVSSFNNKGPFDILSQHESFISLIKNSVLIRISEKQEKRIELTSGVLKVRNNKVEIYVGILR